VGTGSSQDLVNQANYFIRKGSSKIFKIVNYGPALTGKAVSSVKRLRPFFFQKMEPRSIDYTRHIFFYLRLMKIYFLPGTLSWMPHWRYFR